MGATNTTGKLAASLMKEGPAKPEFKQSVDVVNGGVMLAIPALLHCGLLLPNLLKIRLMLSHEVRSFETAVALREVLKLIALKRLFAYFMN